MSKAFNFNCPHCKTGFKFAVEYNRHKESCAKRPKEEESEIGECVTESKDFNCQCPNCRLRWIKKQKEAKKESDPVNHPAHYTSHPSGVECIQITEHMNFCLGNVVKYIWRADLKDYAFQDLEKAMFYLKKEIDRREKAFKSSYDKVVEKGDA